MRVDVKKSGKRDPGEIGVDLLRLPEFQAARDGIQGFLLSRLKFDRETAWEGPRDVDQGFRIVSRGKD
jgi:hypothetical protein